MKIFSWNVNGLRAVISKNFREFVEECAPDVLCLQETKISGDLVETLDLPFKYKYFNCAEKKGYSGTAILSNIKPLDAGAAQLCPRGGDSHPDEGRITAADFGDFKLVCAYVPNSQGGLVRLPYRRRWNADFIGFLKSKKPVVVCGDLNVAHCEIDLARPDDNHFSAGYSDEEREDFSELLARVPLVDVWRRLNPDSSGKYTWWSYRAGARKRGVGWRIDYFLVSPELMGKVRNCRILDDIEGSDHCPVMLDIEL